MLQLDPECFDSGYYAEENPDLPRWDKGEMFFYHWARSGQFEPRKYRYMECEGMEWEGMEWEGVEWEGVEWEQSM